jgi:hypothetical protein
VTNKTNFALIAAATGADNSDHWPSKQIALYPDMVPFQGKITESIRVRRAPAPTAQPVAAAMAQVAPTPAPAALVQATAPTAPAAPVPAAVALNDTIPF